MIDPIVRKAEALRARLDALNVVSSDANWAAVSEQIDYLLALYTGTNTALVSPATVDRVGSLLETAGGHLVSFAASLDPARATDILAVLVTAIEASAVVPQLGRNPDITHRAAIRFRDAGRQATKELEETVGRLDKAVADLGEKVSTNDATISAATADVEARIVAALAPLEQRIEQNSTNLAAQQTQISTVATRQIEEGSKAEAERVKQFSDTVTELREEHRTYMDGLRDAAEENAKRVEEISEDLIAKTREHEQTAGKLAAGAAEKAVSGGFLEDAREHRRARFLFMAAATICLGLAALFGFWVVQILHEAPTSLEFIAGRILVVLPIVGLGIYFFREGGRHRDAAAVAKSLHLDHQAFTPYVAIELNTESRSALRKEMAERAFFRERSVAATKDAPDYVAKLVDAAAEAIKALAKRS